MPAVSQQCTEYAPIVSGAAYGIGRARLNPATVEMRLCVANWMEFIARYKGALGYDYNFGDRQRPKMTVDDIRQQVASLLSCEYDDCDESEKDNEADDGGQTSA